MSLEFLTPGGPIAPPARSPLADPADGDGAVRELRHGWEVAVSHGDLEAEAAACADSVGYCDVSHLVKVEVQGGRESIGSAAEAVAGRAPEPGRAAAARGVWHCPVRPDQMLLVGESTARDNMLEPYDRAGLRSTDLTAALAALAIVGPRSRELFSRFCAIDLRESRLPNGGFRPGSVARTPGYVLRVAGDGFLMLFGSALGQYIWEVVSDAAGPLGGRPVGLDSLGSPVTPVEAGSAVTRREGARA